LIGFFSAKAKLEKKTCSQLADNWNAEHCSAGCGKRRCFMPSNARRSGFSEVSFFVEIISLTPRFNAVNHERAQEKTV
jgi:hypothetical protein